VLASLSLLAAKGPIFDEPPQMIQLLVAAYRRPSNGIG